eukprot:3998044-Prymnesium_polylepis.1
MFGHLAFASTTSKKYETNGTKSPARVVNVVKAVPSIRTVRGHVVREPRPEASVARSECSALRAAGSQQKMLSNTLAE